ncbi:MAG: hypothetical protein SH847_05390 [Roseiflexaceae bacterium]|nr:hypothetical protein [Roseiflexaceae bacterium]
MYNGNGYLGGRRIPPLYIYIGVGILALLAIWFVGGFIRAGVEGYFTLAAGLLLILGNLRDLISNPYPSRSNTALLNTLIGGGLVTYFLGRGGFPPIGWVWYVPAVLLLVIAAPLMLGRASVYASYLGVAKDAASNVRRAVGSLMVK